MSAALRRTRLHRGGLAETAAALLLVLKGYRIVARRLRTPLGEIDIVAVRGRRVAFVEVKARQNFAEAEAALTPKQRGRVRRAAALWLARHPRFQDCEQGFDLILAVPWRWPRHRENAL